MSRLTPAVTRGILGRLCSCMVHAHAMCRRSSKATKLPYIEGDRLGVRRLRTEIDRDREPRNDKKSKQSMHTADMQRESLTCHTRHHHTQRAACTFGPLMPYLHCASLRRFFVATAGPKTHALEYQQHHGREGRARWRSGARGSKRAQDESIHSVTRHHHVR